MVQNYKKSKACFSLFAVLAVLSAPVAAHADDGGLFAGLFNSLGRALSSFFDGGSFSSSDDSSQTAQNNAPVEEARPAPVQTSQVERQEVRSAPVSSSPAADVISNGFSRFAAFIAEQNRIREQQQQQQQAQLASQETQQPGQPQTIVTEDSSFSIPVTLPQDVHWLMVKFDSSNHQESLFTVGAKGGSPLQKLYTPLGAGTYMVTLYTSPNASLTDQGFRPLVMVNVVNKDARDLQNLLPSLMVQNDSPEVIEAARSAVENAVTDREKALRIHDWIASNIKYDYESFLNNTMTLRSYDALAVLHAKSGICEGYSDLFAAMLRAQGIRARVIFGKIYQTDKMPADQSPQQICSSAFDKNHDHAWNEIYIDNRWVPVDMTFDAGYSNDGTAATWHATPGNYVYFDIQQSEFDQHRVRCSEQSF